MIQTFLFGHNWRFRILMEGECEILHTLMNTMQYQAMGVIGFSVQNFALSRKDSAKYRGRVKNALVFVIKNLHLHVQSCYQGPNSLNFFQ